MRIGLALVAAAPLLLSGCLTGGSDAPAPSLVLGPGKSQGAVNSRIITAMGSGLIGNAGSRLSQDEKRIALEAEYRALEFTPAGQSVGWQGSEGSRSGEVVAAQPYRVGSQDCRQYSHTLTIDGQKQTARGTACRNGDGSWTPLT